MNHSMEDIQQKIANDINSNRVVLYMKGTKSMPMCGFSARVVQILNQHGIDYITFNVLESEELRQGIKDFSDWPTIPQLYIDGEFIGGCDIVTQLNESGELKELLS